MALVENTEANPSLRSAAKTRRVLIVAHQFPPENLIGAYRPARFAKYLPAFGYEPLVLTASQQMASAPPSIHVVPFAYNFLELIFFRTFFPYDERLTWVRRAVSSAKPWLAGQAPDLIFSTSPPLANHFTAYQLAKHFRVPWVADFRDPVAGNFARSASLSRWIDPKIEKFLVRRASLILMNTEPAARTLQSRHPRASTKILTLPNGFDPAEEFPQANPPLRPAPLWFHGGSLYLNRYPLRLLESLARLQLSCKVRMVGSLTDASLLNNPIAKELMAQGRLEIETTVKPKAEALREFASADATLVFDHYHGGGPNLALPAKSFDCIRAGRPILAFTLPSGPLDQLLSYSGIPNVRIYEDDPPAIIDEKVKVFAALPRQTVPPSQDFLERHSAPRQTAQLAQWFDRLLAKP